MVRLADSTESVQLTIGSPGGNIMSESDIKLDNGLNLIFLKVSCLFEVKTFKDDCMLQIA